MKKRTFTLAAAAQFSGISEEELQTAVKDGLIAGRRLENTGLVHVDEEELERYMRRSRRQELTDREPSRRVLIVEDDIRYAESLKLDLERDARLGSRTVTWGRDAIALIQTYKPHLCLLGWRSPDDQVWAVVEFLAMRNIRRQTRILAYGSSTLKVEAGEDPDARLKSYGIAVLHSKTRGLSALVGECYAALGIEPGASLPQKHGAS